MSKIKLVAMDLDDTLLSSSLKITAHTKRVIEQIQASGVHVTLATGRMYRSTLPFAVEIGITEPLITYQGALVKDISSGEVLYYQPVPMQVAKEVLQKGYELDIHINIYLNDTLFVDGITEEGIGYARLARVELHPVGNLLEFLKDDPVKIIFIAEEKMLDELQPFMEEKYGRELYITRSKPHYLEFMHAEANKGRALAALAESLGVAREEVFAIGDSFNDLPMIEYAGLGVAMGNARQEVQAQADYVTATNDDEGVARALEKFILSEENDSDRRNGGNR